jgi:hypothetical protein
MFFQEHFVFLNLFFEISLALNFCICVGFIELFGLCIFIELSLSFIKMIDEFAEFGKILLFFGVVDLGEIMAEV